MANHTPGPWHWNHVATIWNTKGYPDEVEREVIIAQVVTDWGDGEFVEPITVREANARLIAAAPDLLEAVEAALQYFKDEGGYTMTMLNQLESAIRKARAD